MRYRGGAEAGSACTINRLIRRSSAQLTAVRDTPSLLGHLAGAIEAPVKRSLIADDHRPVLFPVSDPALWPSSSLAVGPSRAVSAHLSP
jgi:hypothetical protein